MALPGLMTAIIIVGGVLSGIFTVTESGAFGAIYAFVVTIIVYRALPWKKFKQAVINSVRTTSMVMILIACSGAFAYLLTFYQVPTKMSVFLTDISDNPVVILLMINLMLLFLGMIMDMAALILICTPIFLPVASSIGVDPYQFGMILLMNLGLGLCTPPVGSVSICRLCCRWCQVRGCGENNMALLSCNINCFDARNIHSRNIAYVTKSSWEKIDFPLPQTWGRGLGWRGRLWMSV